MLFSLGGEGTLSQSISSWKLGLEGHSSETLVVLRSEVCRTRGVEHFCKPERTRGTRILMTVGEKTPKEKEGKEALFPLGILGSEDGP